MSSFTAFATGSVQQFTVPSGVYSLLVDMAGAAGGSEATGSATLVQGTTCNAGPGCFYGTGGNGARVRTTLAVIPGQTIYLTVGGKGGDNSGGYGSAAGAGGYNGGGAGSYGASGGGGASDIRVGGTNLANRVVVAAGGGGASWGCSGQIGGAGGGLQGLPGISYVMLAANTVCNGAVGGGGTQTAGGAGGNGNAYNGGLGVGGTGVTGSGFAGGGGGGYYGGGQGYNQGGGGGSSYASLRNTSNTVMTAGYEPSNGYITLYYASPAGSNIFIFWYCLVKVCR